jgi:hypothetical protein
VQERFLGRLSVQSVGTGTTLGFCRSVPIFYVTSPQPSISMRCLAVERFYLALPYNPPGAYRPLAAARLRSHTANSDPGTHQVSNGHQRRCTPCARTQLSHATSRSIGTLIQFICSLYRGMHELSKAEVRQVPASPRNAAVHVRGYVCKCKKNNR